MYQKILVFLFVGLSAQAFGQSQENLIWSKDGQSYYILQDGNIVIQNPTKASAIQWVDGKTLIPAGAKQPIAIQKFTLSSNQDLVLIQTNSKRVWRYETMGDFYLLNIKTHQLKQIGKGLPASSLQFAKISPNNQWVAFVSGHNIYAEDLLSGKRVQLTKDGTKYLINGTFDWAYEEEFFCRDGFRWSPDSKNIAFWQVNANGVKNYLMINNTDAKYPFAVPVEYPIAGEKPSLVKIGVVELATAKTKWIETPDDAVLGTYMPRMEWVPNSKQLIIQHLNRKQNTSQLLIADVATAKSKTIYTEQEKTWIDIMPSWDQSYANGGWDWLEDGKHFLWANESDGWRHFYIQSIDGSAPVCITPGNYDVMKTACVDIKNHQLFFYASPNNATQQYLYVKHWDTNQDAQLLTPIEQLGSHDYTISPNGTIAKHSFSNINIRPVDEWVSLPNHQAIGESTVNNALAKVKKNPNTPQFFKVTTVDGIEMDAWMVKPQNFDSTKKYPIVFYVYTEPWGQTAKDEYGTGYNFLYQGSMAADGYIYVSMDNRGTPVPKGKAWRKSVYQKIGEVNIRDQAMGAKELLKLPFVDTSRVAVWGWSGGGSATLNLMFQYPEIYKTGISIAGVGSQLTYDNIYQERYMGLPQEDASVFVKGSPITYAKNLKGNLLYIHGTGDDNVHYQNAELLINELIKQGKQFSLMSYPNRSHSISEGEGTREHLMGLYTRFLRQNCPPGGK
jgi:dipeptidyl-peptidase-4